MVNKKGKIGAIVQARMSSVRLPGKVLAPIIDKPVLWHIVDRLSYSKMLDLVVIATTVEKGDIPVVNFADKNNICCYYYGRIVRSDCSFLSVYELVSF